jgi:hypothetical protein
VFTQRTHHPSGKLRFATAGASPEENRAMLGTILLIILILLLIGALPVYPYSRKWGYGPGGLVGTLLVILIVLLLLGYV